METSLRRIIESPMDDDFYHRLGENPDVNTAWTLLRKDISKQLFRRLYMTVPFLTHAVYFNELFVFTKKPSVLSSLRIKPPAYKIIANLDYIVNRDVSTSIPEFDYSPWDIADAFNMFREFNLRLTTNNPHRVPNKSVELEVFEAHARRVQPPAPGCVTIRRNLLKELSGIETLYVITDVVLASYIKIQVNIGASRKVLIYDTDTPIGFRYRKYRLDYSGRFISEERCGLKLATREATWLVPAPQPVPPMPRWTRRRRSSAVVRKLRHNLTIPTPEVPIRNANRFPQRNGNARNDRRYNNNAVLLPGRELLGINDDDYW